MVVAGQLLIVAGGLSTNPFRSVVEIVTRAVRQRQSAQALGHTAPAGSTIVASGPAWAVNISSPVIPAESAVWFQTNVSVAVRRRSSCVPVGAVHITTVNQELASFGRYTLSRAEPCWLQRFVSFCWGVGEGAATSGSIYQGTCVAAPDVPLSEFKRAMYYPITWAKYELLLLAMSVSGVQIVMFVDADVLLLSNPWTPLLAADQGLLRNHDLLYQCERSPPQPWRLCSSEDSHCEEINTGQIVVTDPRFLVHALRHKPTIFGPDTQISQQIIQEQVVKNGSWRTASLSPTYGSACWFPDVWNLPPSPPGMDPADHADWCMLTSFHANCVYGGTAAKIRRFEDVLNRTAHCPRSAQITCDRHTREKKPVSPRGSLVEPT